VTEVGRHGDVPVTEVGRHGDVTVTPPDTDTDKQKHKALFSHVSMLGMDKNWAS